VVIVAQTNQKTVVGDTATAAGGEGELDEHAIVLGDTDPRTLFDRDVHEEP